MPQNVLPRNRYGPILTYQLSLQDTNGWTLLHRAAAQGSVEMIEILMDRDPTTFSQANDGKTPIDCAIDRQHTGAVKVLESLVEKHFGKSPKAWEGKHELYRAVQDKIGNSPIHFAAMEGNITRITELKEAGADISALSCFKKTPMHSAAWHGHASVIEVLTEAGASVSTQDMLGYSPLHWAALRGHVDALTALIKAGANLEAHTQTEETALDLGTRHRNSKLMELLRTASWQRTTRLERWVELHRAAADGNDDQIKSLLKLGVSFSLPDKHGITALHRAAYNGHNKTVRILRNAGADVDAQDAEGWTALHWAAECGHSHVILALLDLGADPLIKDNKNRTALDIAYHCGLLRVGEALKAAGKNFDRNKVETA